MSNVSAEKTWECAQGQLLLQTQQKYSSTVGVDQYGANAKVSNRKQGTEEHRDDGTTSKQVESSNGGRAAERSKDRMTDTPLHGRR